MLKCRLQHQHQVGVVVDEMITRAASLRPLPCGQPQQWLSRRAASIWLWVQVAGGSGSASKGSMQHQVRSMEGADLLPCSGLSRGLVNARADARRTAFSGCQSLQFVVLRCAV